MKVVNANNCNSVGGLMTFNYRNRWVTTYLPIILLTIAAILRYFFIFKWHLPEKYLFSDMRVYFNLAEKMVAGSITEENFFQPIGLPLLESIILKFNNGSLSLLSWINLTTSVATLYFIWETTKKLTNPFLALLALEFSSFHYPFIFIAGTYLSECIFTFILSLLVWLLAAAPYPWKQTRTYFLGLVIGISLLIKGTFIFYLPIFLIWLFFKNLSLLKTTDNKFEKFFEQLKPGFILATGTLTVMLIHGSFSYSKIDKFLISPTNGGLNFMEGKCPWKKNIDSNGWNWLSPLYYQTQETEERKWPEPFTNSAYFFKQGFNCIVDDPMVLAKSLQSIPYLFINNDFWPSLNTLVSYKNLSRNYSLFFAFWILPALCFSLLYLMKNGSNEKTIVWVLPILTIFLTVFVFKSEVRFRVPFDVILIPVGIWGWDLILNSIFTDWAESRRNNVQTLVTSIMVFLVTSALIWP